MIYLLFFFSIANAWSVEFLKYLPVFVTVMLLTYIVCFLEQKRRYIIILVCIILVSQYALVEREPLVSNSPEHEVEIRNNMAAYPYMRLPFMYWFEKKYIVQEGYSLERRFGELVNVNLYFFSNHPRERIGYREYEKFQYILLPFFVVGIFRLIKAKKYYLLVCLFALPVLLMTLIGNRGELGPFSLFPFISLCVWLGMKHIFKKRNTTFWMFCILWVLVSIQIYALTIF